MATETMTEVSSTKALSPLPTAILPDPRGNYYHVNPTPTAHSKCYTNFPSPIEDMGSMRDPDNTGFDCHVYFDHTSALQTSFAERFHTLIRRSFPELRIGTIAYEEVGPHTTGNFEVDLWTPEQFGAFLPWLVVNRGPLSVLVHPNSEGGIEEGKKDHLERAIWLGEKMKIKGEFFDNFGQ